MSVSAGAPPVGHRLDRRAERLGQHQRQEVGKRPFARVATTGLGGVGLAPSPNWASVLTSAGTTGPTATPCTKVVARDTGARSVIGRGKLPIDIGVDGDRRRRRQHQGAAIRRRGPQHFDGDAAGRTRAVVDEGAARIGGNELSPDGGSPHRRCPGGKPTRILRVSGASCARTRLGDTTPFRPAPAAAAA